MPIRHDGLTVDRKVTAELHGLDISVTLFMPADMAEGLAAQLMAAAQDLRRCRLEEESNGQTADSH